ncbi:mirror-image polydactyly gene 1 protein isoform X3 [Phacochoerus africanus]|uniref:mirror-image polydactyly gene 1 protein isoform X3 n=1 Tax=Phacochoerus africanus TaxID=41426 RepID=UPI001FDA6914|nr:mirror-image polydactyly gene 1 protein isoform X3 [Phacochoerus africanus]
MEDWSKDITRTYLEQETTGRKKSILPDEQRTVNSKGSIHQKPYELINKATYEDTKPPEQRSRSFEVISLDPGDETAYCTTEKSNIMEHRNNDLDYECMIPSQVTSDLDQEKTIAFLLKELEILKASNKKLQEKLTEEDKEQRRLKLKLELQEKALEAQIAEKTAALVEEVYFAQRERDEAIMSRLQLANEERDEAVARAKHMEMSLKVLENINPEENDMCKRLEQELHHLKEQNQTSANNMRHLTAENNQERALKKRGNSRDKNYISCGQGLHVKEEHWLQCCTREYFEAKLLAMQQARETAVQQYKKLEEEIQTLRVYYSLHKSLSQEESLKDQFNHTLSTYEEALKNRENIVSITQQQNDELSIQLQQALTDRANMELELQHAVEASRAANDKVQKLERLVDVLRKKVGTGTMRTVI